MSEFEIVERGQFAAGVDALPEGTVSISKNGRLTARTADLALAGIDRAAVVMVDRQLSRIAMRAPRDEAEREKSVAVCAIRAKSGRHTGRSHVSVLQALRRLSLTPDVARGRHELAIKGESPGAVLILNLLGTK